jgi:plasmid replication initiation protein
MTGFSLKKVTKANHLIQASYSMTLQEKKLVLAALSCCDSRGEPKKTVSISASNFAEVTGMDLKHAHTELYKAADKLFDRSIKVSDPEQTEEFRWIQSKIKKHKGEGLVTLTWSDPILKYISQLKTQFTSYRLGSVGRLQSVYSIRLYELLMQFSKTGDRVISVSDFRDLLELEDKYKQFKDLNKWVIKPAVKELNQRSDLDIAYETISSGRKVRALSFTFKPAKQMKMAV